MPHIGFHMALISSVILLWVLRINYNSVSYVMLREEPENSWERVLMANSLYFFIDVRSLHIQRQYGWKVLGMLSRRCCSSHTFTTCELPIFKLFAILLYSVADFVLHLQRWLRRVWKVVQLNVYGFKGLLAEVIKSLSWRVWTEAGGGHNWRSVLLLIACFNKSTVNASWLGSFEKAFSGFFIPGWRGSHFMVFDSLVWFFCCGDHDSCSLRRVCVC